MFAFHKSDALSRSRQSSVDSSALELSTPPISSDPWGSQCFDAPPNQDMHSPEQRRRAQPGRRSSVFTLRSRSNTANSTASSFVPLSPRFTNDSGLPLESPSLPPHGASQSYFEQHGQRRSMFRGKMGKRLSESLASGAGMDEYQEADTGRKRSSFLRKGRKGTNDSDDSFHFKQRISSPFDFQHLTHANRHNIAALENGSDSMVGAGWAEHTSKFPSRNNEGDVTPFQSLSVENLGLPEGESNLDPGYTSPLSSPRLPYEMRHADAIPQMPASRPGLRLTRSVESFSQPGVASRVHRHSQSTVAPLRAASVVPLAPIDDIPEEDAERQRQFAPVPAHTKRQSGIWDTFVLPTPMEGQLGRIEEDLPQVGHALTTPDDSAIHTPMLPFSPSLEDVAEEPDRFVSPRPAPPPPRNRAPTSPMSPCFESFSFSNPRSAVTQTRNRGNSHTSPKSSLRRSPGPRPSSQMSDTLGSPKRKHRSVVAKPSAQHCDPNTWSTMEDSWEDDVDYIYENALEADCDFDWDYVSDHEPCEKQHQALERAVNDNSSKKSEDKPTFELRFPSGNFRSSFIIPSASSVPDLVATSARSTSTAGLGLQTPFNEGEGFLLSPSLLVPHSYKDAPETSYEDILKEYDGSDCHFPIIDGHQSANSSARSSRVRFSRRSSYDSSLMSSAQGSGLWNSPMRRSASSSGSLPELVYSRQTRREFSIVVDELSEQIASLESLDRDLEDDDVTPPGPSRASESDHESSQKYHTYRESTDFTSQLLSRHQHARSDGAAQLLSSASTTEDKPSKTRTRAATGTRAAQLPHLSLFPSPPKRTTPSATNQTARPF